MKVKPRYFEDESEISIRDKKLAHLKVIILTLVPIIWDAYISKKKLR